MTHDSWVMIHSNDSWVMTHGALSKGNRIKSWFIRGLKKAESNQLKIKHNFQKVESNQNLFALSSDSEMWIRLNSRLKEKPLTQESTHESTQSWTQVWK